MATLSDDDDADGSEGPGSDGIGGGSGGTTDGGILESLVVVGQEIRRSSANAVAVDFLYVFTMAFFATLAVRGLWPALIAAVPVAVLLAFAWLSSRLFFLTNVLVLVASVMATRAGLVPL